MRIVKAIPPYLPSTTSLGQTAGNLICRMLQDFFLKRIWFYVTGWINLSLRLKLICHSNVLRQALFRI